MFCCTGTVARSHWAQPTVPPSSNRCASLSRSVVHVGGRVNNRGQLTDADLKTLLDLLERVAIFIRAHERDGETLGTESAGTAHSVQVGVSVAWHVEVEDDVDLLNVNASSENLSCDQDAVFELLKSLVNFDSATSDQFSSNMLTFPLGESHDG